MVVEQSQKERLDKYGINIKTKYQNGNKVSERNTDNSICENIHNGIILEKNYIKNSLIKKETIFDSRITYTYEFNESKELVCSNCGAISNIDDNTDYCPYCKSNFNIEYTNKNLGSKYYYDLVTKNKSYIFITYIFDFIISLILTSLYIVNTSRTLYFFDMMKIVIGTLLISLILFYFFYYIDAMILLPWIRRKKEKQNNKQKLFWEKMKEKGYDKTIFFNNFIFELRELYFSNKYISIIDFDILDYEDFKFKEEKEKTYVDVRIEIRIVNYIDGKIKSKKIKKSYRMISVNQERELKPGKNEIKCHNCNSSIDVRNTKCKYCGTKNNYYQTWYLEKEID